ncbi:MAG: PSD1 and planctomycete cytochrome C domain-containing protein [Pirellulaceae bacterium]|nr:PSD1 and planctomycete cytochrome C domain-containing protein [Pirellulaceae bacterium]
MLFEKEIRPILATTCVKCHGAKKQEGELRLDSRAGLLKGGASGPAVVPGKPDDSLLLEALRYEDLEMPPKARLADKSVRAFERWVQSGAAWPADDRVREASAGVTAADRSWWAFQPLPKDPQPPRHADDNWSANELDRFVFAQLAQKQMRPAPLAAKRTLIRRLYYDVIGAPPTPREIADFVADESPDAWPRLVNRLLEDPRYGEHWARFWLDLVRYTESDGWNADAYRPHIWRYRDFVVEAFNSDKPYPQFALEQLAGDELPGNDPVGLTAVGFLRLGIYEYNQRDARGHWNDIMNEMTDVAADVFLGVSVSCARCHDHKFDPFTRSDYFQLRAFFDPVVWRDDLVAATDDQRAEYEQALAAWEKATSDVRRRIEELKKPYYDAKWKLTVGKFPLDIQACFNKPEEQRDSWEQQMAYLISRQFLEEGGGPLKSIKKEDKAKLDALQKELAEFDKLKPKPLPPLMTAAAFSGAAAPTHIPDGPDDVMRPGFPAVLSDAKSSSDKAGAEGVLRRTDLAGWIGNPNNPLTTRAIVNRIWQQHFGRGIAQTPNDLGQQGTLPTHPALLDWLAVTFVRDGWSMKQLHRRILLSKTWRQTSDHPQAEQYEQKDPSESLLWRAPVRRLRAEEIRDSLLQLSGELQSQVGGPSVDEKTPRRAIYVKRFRNKTETFLHAFDAAPGLKSVATRGTTTTPTQSLLLINGDYAVGRSEKMAARLLSSSPATAAEIVRSAVVACWGRPPTDRELKQSLAFLASTDQTIPAPDRLADFCHVLFNSNEFLYID